jgi:hypothetical protein
MRRVLLWPFHARVSEPKHPSLAVFPTESHYNWQWFHLVQNSRAVILDAMPAGFRPIVQVIDNYERAHELAILFEPRTSGGKLLVCSIDLAGQHEKPQARQLLHSLLRHVNSDPFTPPTVLDLSILQRILQ